MNAIKIGRKPQNDNYRALALYIVGKTERDPAEKMLLSWFTGCESEELQDALMDIEAVQAINTRTMKEKTYHLILSFRPEDENKLTPEIYNEIEQHIANALGYSEHQRVCGVHKNTNNTHMHIAYNMIHPERYTRYEPLRDFNKLSEACREIEHKYGFVIDRGMDKSPVTKHTNARAKSMEAHAGQESFQSYVLRHKGEILFALQDAPNWQTLHDNLASMGIGLKLSGAGVAIYNRHGNEHVKASSVDRKLSKQKLEQTLGTYHPATPKAPKMVEKERYTKQPLQQYPNRGNLYAEYKQARLLRQKKWHDVEKIKQQTKEQKKIVLEKWAKKRKEIHANTKILARDKALLITKTFELQNKEIITTNALWINSVKETQKAYPWASWNDFLKHKALSGNSSALDILRTKKIDIPQTTKNTQEKDLSAKHNSFDFMEERKKLDENTKLTAKNKKMLLTALGFAEKINQHVKLKIDNTGVLILTLQDSSIIRDAGKEIHFGNDSDWRMAEKYAQAKWGKKNVQQKGNTYIAVPRKLNKALNI